MKRNIRKIEGGWAMNKTRRFKDYLKRSFIVHTALLVGLMFVGFLAIVFFNYRTFTVSTNQECNRIVTNFLARQHTLYESALAALREDSAVHAALGGTRVQEASQLLYQSCLHRGIQANFILLGVDGRIATSNLYKPNQTAFLNDTRLGELQSFFSREPEALYAQPCSMAYGNGQKSLLRLARTLRGASGEILGYLIFDLREESLRNFLGNKSADIILISDKFDNVLYATNALLIDSMGKYRLPDTLPHIEIDSKAYYATAAAVPKTKLQVVTMVLTSRQNQMFLISLFFLSAMCLLTIFLVRLLAARVARETAFGIEELLRAVRECRRGNIGYRIHTRTFGEFQLLYRAFNRMMTKLQRVMRDNEELAERKRRMEIKHLEGQFNPHFVFNILETLRYEMLLHPKEASERIVSFANLMRYSVNYGHTEVPLRSDIAYVKDYLSLQQMRYGDRLRYGIDIGEALLDAIVPKLLVQPIVENSIVHGLEQTRCLTVRLSGKSCAGGFTLSVSDNGPGIAAQTLEHLRNLLGDENAAPEHIGIYNAHRAVRLLYGPPYGVRVESAVGAGTVVTLYLPLRKEAQDV